jgi:hypothetical protein
MDFEASRRLAHVPVTEEERAFPSLGARTQFFFIVFFFFLILSVSYKIDF